MFALKIKEELVEFKQPIVMGIINTTPDSFYTNSRKRNIDDALFVADKMLNDGATIIDVGGQSTRPGSEMITIDEELKRVIPVIESIHQKFPKAIISIDTFQSKVAVEAVYAGALMVNDISGGNLDKAMFSTVAKLKVPYVCMHMKGTPQNMQSQTNYNDVVNEVLNYFIDKIALAKEEGFENLILDIGFGFAKTTKQNFELVKQLKQFQSLQKPLLLGVSRKSSIYKTLGITADEALNGTSVVNTIGIINGANILRVHDVKEAVEVIKLAQYFI
jgi:dihydropteroate synthase